MIRVAYLSDARYEGGAERYLLRLAGALDRTRFEPAVFLPARPLLDPLAARFRERGIPVHRWSRPAAGPLAALSASRAVMAVDPALIHLNFPNPYELGCGGWAMPYSMAGRAVVATEHIADIPASRRRAAQKRLWGGVISRTITISRAHRDLLVDRHGVRADRLVVIENGVEGPEAVPPRDGQPLRLVCVGALERRKGQDLLLRALGALRRRGIACELALVGDGPDRAALERLAAEEAIAASVRWTGVVPSAFEELGRAHVVAVPSRIEGIPFVVLEGMAAGAAPVVSALPGLDEVVDDEVGRLVPAGESAAWESAIGALAADPALVARLGAAARRRWEARYTLERMARETMNLYEAALA